MPRKLRLHGGRRGVIGELQFDGGKTRRRRGAKAFEQRTLGEHMAEIGGKAGHRRSLAFPRCWEIVTRNPRHCEMSFIVLAARSRASLSARTSKFLSRRGEPRIRLPVSSLHHWRAREAERRQALFNNLRTLRARLCPFGAARLPAFHHGSRQRDSSSLRLGFRPGFLGRGLNGRYPPSPVPVQRRTSHPGHNAGRLMPKPPGSGPYSPARGHRTRSAFRNTFAKGVLHRARFAVCNLKRD